jgi:hypothetical protein
MDVSCARAENECQATAAALAFEHVEFGGDATELLFMPPHRRFMSRRRRA